MPPSGRCSPRSAECFDGADLIVTYNGKTFDVPVMETRWVFHRMRAAARAASRTSTCCIRRAGCGGRAPAQAAIWTRRLPAVDARAHAVRRRARRRRARLRDSGPLLPVPPQRRSAAARARARAQPARSGVARGGHGACGPARRGRCTRRAATAARRWRWGAVYERAGDDGPRAARVLQRGDRVTLSREVKGEALYRLRLRLPARPPLRRSGGHLARDLSS